MIRSKMLKTFLENQITFQQIYYKCYTCPKKLNDDFQSALQHITASKHQTKLKEIDKEKAKNQLDILPEMSEDQLKEIVDNSITFDGRLNSFYCHVCKKKIDELCNIFVHTRDISHRLAIKNIISKHAVRTMNRANKKTFNNFDENNFPVVKNDLHSEQLLYQVQLTSTTFNSNSDFIIHDEKSDSYYCSFCKCKFIKSSNNFEHIQDCESKAIFEASNNLKEKKSSSQGFANQMIDRTQNILKNTKIESSEKKTVLQEKYLNSCISEIYCCIICQALLKDSIDIQCHIMLHLFKEFQLMNNFDILEFLLGANGEIHLKCLLCDNYCLPKMSDAHEFIKEHFTTEKHLERLTFCSRTKTRSGLEKLDKQINSLDLKQFTYNTADNICLLKHPYSSDASEKCDKKELQEIQSDSIIEKKTVVDLKDFNYYKCFMCNISFDNASKLFNHFKTPAHKWKIEDLKISKSCEYINFVRLNEMELIYCSLCNRYLNSCQITVAHIKGEAHNKKLALASINQDSNKNIKDTSVSPSKQLVPKHKKISNFASTQNPNDNITENLAKIDNENKFEAINKRLHKLDISTTNIHPIPLLQPDTTDNTLDDLISVNFTRRQTRRLPSHAKPKSPRAPQAEDQRNSFVTNVLQNGRTYISFCINPGLENIYNFHDDTMRLMEFGVSLTFSHLSERFCIPCKRKFPADLQSLFEHLHSPEHLKIICDIIQIDYEEFGTVPEKFSDLRLAKLYMYASGQWIQCHACNIKIKDDDDVIREHAKTSFHEGKSKFWKGESKQLFHQYLTIYQHIWYYAEVYFCEICDKRYKFEIEFVMHLKNENHRKKVDQLKNKNIALKFDLCLSCITYWFGKADYYKAHCQTNIHKRLAESKDFTVPHLTITASEYLDNIDKNIELLVSESNKVDLGKDKVAALLNAIVETVKPMYPHAKAYVFGSRLSHLGFPDSDVDVFLDCENVYYKSSTAEQCKARIKSVESYFESTPNTWIIDEVLLETRVPIIKLRYLPTNMKCDISFVNGLTVEKSQLVGIYNRAFPICRELILFMKKWLFLCRIFGSDCITTFAISWCVIFYLQAQGILPSVHELISRKMESKIVDGWECGFEQIITAGSSNLSFKEHLKGFFTYFANFDYQRNVICPYLGKSIDKQRFAYTDELPPEMDIYKNRLQNNKMEIFRFDSPMCIQDPIDLSQNLTKALKKRHLRCFREYCTLSAKKC